MIAFLVFNISLSLTQTSFAAPIPTTGSSAVNSPRWDAPFAQMGFSLKLVSNEWIFLDNKNESSTTTQELSLGLKTLSETARLSLKIENLKTKMTAENYAKKFLRDYNQYGFEVLSSKTMVLNNSNVVVVDLLQKNKLTQSRQIFFSNKDKMMVASCLDKTALFQMTSNMCNELLNTLSWK